MARLVLICDGDDLVTHKLGNVTTIGRVPLNHIVIDNPAVSAQHAIIGRSEDSYRLKDLDSTNGTQVNGVFITDVELKDGDKIRFGSVVAGFLRDVATKIDETDVVLTNRPPNPPPLANQPTFREKTSRLLARSCSWLFELSRLARAFRSHCTRHRKRESRRDVKSSPHASGPQNLVKLIALLIGFGSP